MWPGFFDERDAVILLFDAAVGKGVGRAAASVRASHTAIWPRPRFAHVAYGIAMNGCSAFFTFPCASRDSPDAVLFTTCTPFSRSGRNSEASVAVSGRTMLRTLPFGLSGHSAAYTIGP